MQYILYSEIIQYNPKLLQQAVWLKLYLDLQTISSLDKLLLGLPKIEKVMKDA